MISVGKTGILESLNKMRIFQPHLIDILIFLFNDLVEIVIV